MPTDEDRIGTGQRSHVCLHEVTHVDVDARAMETMGIFLDDGLTFRTGFKSLNVEVGKLQAGFDAHAAGTETDVPQHMTVGQIKGL